MCITLNTSTCFEQYYAHPQEVKIVFLQHVVSSLSVSGRAVHRLRAESAFVLSRRVLLTVRNVSHISCRENKKRVFYVQ
jgi:hypothetical protein